MSRNQWIVSAVLGLAVVLVFGCFGAYWLMYLMGGLPAQMLGPFQVIGAPTEPAADTPTVLISPTPSVKQTPTSLPTTAKPEPPTPTNTRVIPLTTPPLRSTPIPTEAFSPDNWEPDNTPADASLVAPGDTQTHNLHVEGDQDWLYFQVVAGTTYTIETYNLGDDMDTVVELYDADRTLLTYDDDGGDEILASRLSWAATEGGRLYLMIEHWSGSSAGPSTTYDVSLSLGEAFRIDAYEPDDFRSEASEMAVGGTQTHNLHVEGDQDWLYFQAVAGTTYIIETFNLGDNMDTVIHLYDEEGNELASDDDGGDELWASGLVWTTTEDGSLYIMVEHWGYGAAGPGTDYDISVSRV